MAARRSYPTPEVRAAVERSNPTPRSGGCVGAEGPRGATLVQVRRGGPEEIPLVQGKEQRLHFAGAAMKRYPTPNVRETQGRQ